MARNELMEQAVRYGRPTMHLEFFDGKLHQLFYLRDGEISAERAIWVEVRGQDG